MQKTLRDGVVTPFLKAYAKKLSAVEGVTADDVAELKVDGIAMADNLPIAPLVSGRVAPIVYVYVWPSGRTGRARSGGGLVGSCDGAEVVG